MINYIVLTIYIDLLLRVLGFIARFLGIWFLSKTISCVQSLYAVQSSTTRSEHMKLFTGPPKDGSGPGRPCSASKPIRRLRPCVFSVVPYLNFIEPTRVPFYCPRTFWKGYNREKY